MSLPKIEHPIVKIEVPSTKKKVNFRPMLVKEEKILLMAKVSEDDTDIFGAVQQIVNNCALDKEFDINKLAIFDLQYLFLKIRAISVGEETEVSFRDNEDGETYDFKINLNDIKVEFPEKTLNKIEISDTAGFTMKYPQASLYADKEFLKTDAADTFDLLVVSCIDKIYSGDDIYEASLYKKEELKEFMDNLTIATFDKVREFFGNIPSMKHEIKYTNKMGTERTIVLRDLNDFFTLR